MNVEKYETQSDGNGHIFTFISKGVIDIVKVVKYDKEKIVYYIDKGKILEAYNLGFGDKVD